MVMLLKKLLRLLRMKFEIKFINHACFQILKDDFSILVDPWFSGKIFNDSWQLIQETSLDDVDLSKLKYIFISHEHPDHLNWGTLKKIRNKVDHEIKVVMAARKNSNVAENINRLGYDYVEVLPWQHITSEKDNFSFCFLKKNHDSGISFDIDGKIILNKNDCEYTPEELRMIKGGFEKRIDILLDQFSLAGYYANKQDKHSLFFAREKHILNLLKSMDILNPRLTIPFASFITFCRPENRFVNDYIVNLQDILDRSKSNIFVPYYNEDIPMGGNEKQSLENCKKWRMHFEKAKKEHIDTVPTVSEEDLISGVGEMRSQMCLLEEKRIMSLANVNADRTDFTLHLSDIDKFCNFNFKKDNISFFDKNELDATPIASVHTYDLLGFFKNHWGADTMNITSCFTVFDLEKWRYMLTFRDKCYVR